MVATTAADWMTAFGTDGAVVVALATTTVLALRQRRRRPVLDCRVGDSEPLLRLEPNPAQPESVAVRIAVHNTGRGPAKNVRLHLQRCWHSATGVPIASGPWSLSDIDPLPFGWVSHQNAESVEIAAHSWDLSNVVRMRWSDRRLSITGLERSVEVEPYYDLGEYRFEVIVSADGIDARPFVFGFEKSAASQIVRPYVSEVPPPNATHGGGYLDLIQAAQAAGELLPHPDSSKGPAS
jgi:hypothetical protein